MKHNWVMLCVLWAGVASLAAAGVMLKPTGGRIEIYGTDGAYRGSLGASGVADAQSDGRIIALLHYNGRVEVYDASGSYRASISVSGARRVQVCDGYIGVQTESGRVEVYDASGAYKLSF